MKTIMKLKSEVLSKENDFENVTGKMLALFLGLIAPQYVYLKLRS